MGIQAVDLAKEFVAKNEVCISDMADMDAIVQKLAEHIDALIFNVTSLAVMVAMIEDKKKVEPRHLVSAQAYIAHQCVGKQASQKILGGGVQNEIPEIEGFGPKDAAPPMEMRAFIHHVLDYHKLTIGKGAMKGILTIIHAHLGCLLKDLRASEPLTMKRLDQVFSMRRHAVFK